MCIRDRGYVCEGSGENIFIVKNGKLFTPSLSSALEGITRDSVITIANDLGIDVMEKNLTRDEIYTADEAFLTGTAAEVTPIKQLDRRNIVNGSKGEITDKIQSLYFDIVQGENEQYKNWLTYIA